MVNVDPYLRPVTNPALQLAQQINPDIDPAKAVAGVLAGGALGGAGMASLGALRNLGTAAPSLAAATAPTIRAAGRPLLTAAAPSVLGRVGQFAGTAFKNPVLSKGALLKGGVAGLAAQLAGGAVGNAVGGDAGRVIGGATTGAGIGAGLGSFIFPGVGTALGAAGGGVIGGLLGLGGGEKKPKQISDSKLLDLVERSVDQTTANQIMNTYNVLMELATTDEEKAMARATVGQMLLEGVQQQQSQAVDQQKMLATQALAAQFFQPFTKQILDSANMRFKTTESLLPSLPESYRGVAQQQNVAALDNATRLANAYAAQAQMIPAMATLQNQMSINNQLAQQQMMQRLNGGASGGSSLADLVSQVGVGGQ